MNATTHSARITSPLSYRAETGRMHNIPVGPCLIERLNVTAITIIWGERGQRSVALTLEEVTTAHEQGFLVLLD